MADDTASASDTPITIEVTGNGPPPEFDISDTAEGTVTVEANRPSPWPLLIALAAFGALLYFGEDDNEYE